MNVNIFKKMSDLNQLKEVISRLRGPDGCPWDQIQTHESLIPYLVEETAEVIEAIENKDPSCLCDELGDLLFQVLLHAHIASERKEFALKEVIKNLLDKLIRRHPHVFGDKKIQSIEELYEQWEAIKLNEKEGRPTPIPRLDVQKHLPALSLASSILHNINKFLNKNDLHDIKKQAQKESRSSTSEFEMGQRLFQLVEEARAKGLDPEKALRAYSRSLLNNTEALLNTHPLDKKQQSPNTSLTKIQKTLKKISAKPVKILKQIKATKRLKSV